MIAASAHLDRLQDVEGEDLDPLFLVAHEYEYAWLACQSQRLF